MATILYGKEISERIAKRLSKRVALLRRKPKLVIIQVGDLEESNVYIKYKKAFGEKISVNVLHQRYKENVSSKKLIADILKFNKDKSIKGIMIQLPLPGGLDKNKVIESITPEKDVDGLTQNSNFLPATARGIISLLKYSKVKIKGQKATVVGASDLVGKPTAKALKKMGAQVTLCDSRTKNLEKETKRADILIVAVGKRNLIKKEHISSKQVVVDIGINVFWTKGKRRVVGDVDFKNVKDFVKAITPVPGGVGPMTVAALFENLLEA